jgi:hypothetical protein
MLTATDAWYFDDSIMGISTFGGPASAKALRITIIEGN